MRKTPQSPAASSSASSRSSVLLRRRLMSGVAMLAPLLAFGTAVYQQRKAEFLAPLTAPCAPEQLTILSKVDVFILQHREQILEWYALSCEINNADCQPIPGAVFDSYSNGSIGRFCSSIQSLSRKDSPIPDLHGADLTPLTGRSSITLMPNLFSEMKGDDAVCPVAATDFHERIHAVTGYQHPESEDPNIPDFARRAGHVVTSVCADSQLPVDPSLSPLKRYQRALQEVLKRLKLQEETAPGN